MHNLFDWIHDEHVDEKAKIESGFTVFYGWAVSLYILYGAPTLTMLFSWATVIKLFFSLGTLTVTMIVKSVVTTFIDYCKPKVLKYGNKKKILIMKFLNHGKEKPHKKRA